MNHAVLARHVGTATGPLLLAVVLGAALALSSGIALAATIRCKSNQTCVGTREADLLKGTDGKNVMRGRGGKDTLRGRGDTDRLEGGADNDTLAGGGGGDIYWFAGNAWGRDTIVDDIGTGSANSLYFSSPDPSSSDFPPVTDDLTITLSPDSTKPEVVTGSGTSSVNWSEALLFTTVLGGEDDDTITGDDASNSIAGGRGADTIDGGESRDNLFGSGFGSGPEGAADADSLSGGGGNDEIVVMDGAGGDIVDCGDGDDLVWADAGDIIAANCEFVTGF